MGHMFLEVQAMRQLMGTSHYKALAGRGHGHFPQCSEWVEPLKQTLHSGSPDSGPARRRQRPNLPCKAPDHQSFPEIHSLGHLRRSWGARGGQRLPAPSPGAF